MMRRALGIANVEEKTLALVGVSSHRESVRKGVSIVECHDIHPEKEANESVLNDVAKSSTEDCVQQLLV